MRDGIVTGFTSGQAKPVVLNLASSGQSKNTFIVGVSGSGKSVLGRSVISRGVQLGFKVVILELKDDPDYAPWYPSIKPFIAQSSDPDVLGELLGLGQDKIDLLIHLEIEEGMDWSEVLEKLKEAVNPAGKVSKEYKLSSRDRRNAQSVQHYLKQLINNIKTMELSKDLKELPPVSVMNLRHFPVMIQQIVARSTAQWILENRTNTILFIDEFKRISPQGATSAANNMMIRYASEGRARGDFLIALNQTIVGVNDEVRSSFLNWILGKAIDVTKAKRVQEQIKMAGLALQLEQVAQLQTGEFFVLDFNDLTVQKMFAWADWISEEDAKAVARGEKRMKELPPPPNAPAVIPGIRLFAPSDVEDNNDSRSYKQSIPIEKPNSPKQLTTQVTAHPIAIEEVPALHAPVESSGMDTPSSHPQVRFANEETDVRVNSSFRPENYTTDDDQGKIMYILCVEFHGRNTDNSAIKTAIREHIGWLMSDAAYATAKKSLKDRNQIKEDTHARIRLPLKVHAIYVDGKKVSDNIGEKND